MCHAHGVHSSTSKNDLNLTATSDSPTYAPGATVNVTVDGGYRDGTARAVLFDQVGTQIDISTGAPSGGVAPVNAPLWPVTLSAPAPDTPGAYTWTVSWYGNRYDLTEAGTGTTFFGPNWIADSGNANHGFESVFVNFTVVAGPPGPDDTAPIVSSTSPDNNAVNVLVNAVIIAIFNEAIDNTTVDNTTFTVTFNAGADNVAGTVTVSADNTTVTFTPSAPLLDNTLYTATLDNTITDLAGNALADNVVWSFTTGATTTPPPPPPPSGDNDSGWCAIAGTGGSPKQLIGGYGFLMLVALGLRFRRRRKR